MYIKYKQLIRSTNKIKKVIRKMINSKLTY